MLKFNLVNISSFGISPVCSNYNWLGSSNCGGVSVLIFLIRVPFGISMGLMIHCSPEHTQSWLSGSRTMRYCPLEYFGLLESNVLKIRIG